MEDKKNSFSLLMEFLRIADAMNIIIESDAITWEQKYNMVFMSKRSIAKQISDTDVLVEWVDLDTSYEEDVTRYHNAVQETADQYRKFLVEAGQGLHTNQPIQ